MRVLVFGDSITWGAHDQERGGWATRLRNHFGGKDNDVNVYNLGISGDTTVDLLNRVEAESDARNPDVIIYAIGINDAQYLHSEENLLTPTEEFQKNISKLLNTAETFTTQIIFVGLTRVDESKTDPLSRNNEKSYLNKHIDRFDTKIKNLCNENEITFISMKNVLRRDDLSDGLHPNTKGHKKMFKNIEREINPLT